MEGLGAVSKTTVNECIDASGQTYCSPVIRTEDRGHLMTGFRVPSAESTAHAPTPRTAQMPFIYDPQWNIGVRFVHFCILRAFSSLTLQKKWSSSTLGSLTGRFLLDTTERLDFLSQGTLIIFFSHEKNEGIWRRIIGANIYVPTQPL